MTDRNFLKILLATVAAETEWDAESILNSLVAGCGDQAITPDVARMLDHLISEMQAIRSWFDRDFRDSPLRQTTVEELFNQWTRRN